MYDYDKDKNLIKSSAINFIGTIAFFICLGIFYGKRNIYSDELLWTISLIFPVIAHLYNWTKYKNLFWKSFLIGTISAMLFLFIGVILYMEFIFG